MSVKVRIYIMTFSHTLLISTYHYYTTFVTVFSPNYCGEENLVGNSATFQSDKL